MVPVVNAYRLALAAGEKMGSPEVHSFADASYGFGVDTVGKPVEAWTEICGRWLGQREWSD